MSAPIPVSLSDFDWLCMQTMHPVESDPSTGRCYVRLNGELYVAHLPVEQPC